MPAMDMANNEADCTKNLSLAFIGILRSFLCKLLQLIVPVASGDLRHVVRTFNALSSDYSGSLKILVYDRILLVASRNMVLLLVFGTIPDEASAADTSGIRLSYLSSTT
jgi:hypothetical protein